MAEYYREIQRVIHLALSELEAVKAAGRLPNNPISDNHFLIRWITSAIKSQRFSRCVVNDLVMWQKEGRTKGSNTQLPTRFKQYQHLYRTLASVEVVQPINKEAILNWTHYLDELGWCVTTEYEVLEKASLFSNGAHSLIICSTQFARCFEDGQLVQPLTCYVRGNHHQFVESAFSHHLMVHKCSNYKSKVKYHGEYVIYPNNHGKTLAEIPFSFHKVIAR